MEIKTSKLFPSNFNNLFRAVLKNQYTEYVLPGGRFSCKSSIISICIRLLMRMHPSVSALVVRKTADTMRDSVYAQLLWADDQLGLLNKQTTSPLSISNGAQKVIFKGSDKPTKIKSIKVERGYIGILWFEEVTEFRPDEVRSIIQSFLRGGQKFWIFYSYNPPTNRNNWCNRELAKEKPGRIIVPSTYLTVNPDWLGEKAIAEANWLKENNFRLYQNEYMGECTGSGLDVFENVKDTRLTDDEIGKFDYFFHGVDWGYYPDPWAYCGMAYKPNTRELFIFDELKAYKQGNQETSNLLLDHFKAGAWKWYNHAEPKSPAECGVKLTPDSAEPKSIADYRAYGWHCHEPTKTGLRDYGYKWLQSLTAIHIDRVRAPDTWAEFTGYEYQVDKNGDIISTYPEGQADHFIACVRYGMEEIYRRKGL